MVTDRSPEGIGKLRRHVQALLDERCRKKKLGFALKIKREFLEADWLYFTVAPNRKGVRAYDYAAALSDVEMKLRRKEHEERVLLMPALED